MKKYFDIEETVRYSHRITIEVDESQEDVFEEFAEDMAESIEGGCYDNKDSIVYEFREAFENVEYCENGSQDVRFEAY